MRINVFFQTAEKPTGLREENSRRLSALEEKLAQLRKEIQANPKETAKVVEIQKTREEILALRREMNRTKQFTEISSHKLAGGKNNLDGISAGDLMRIDKEISKEKRGEILSKSFLYKRTTDSEGNIFEEPTDGKTIKEGDTLFVDFGKNRSAESKIGMGDFLPISLQVVKIIDQNGNIRIGKRSIQGNKVGYYDENGYIPVYNGFKVEIPKKEEVKKYLDASDPEIPLSTDIDSENTAKDAFIEVADRYDAVGGGSPWELEKRQAFQKEVTEIAKEMEAQYGVPWQVTYAQAALESGWGRSAPGNNYFGVKGVGQELQTREFRDGKTVIENASFRTYASMRESFEDHAQVLKKQWPHAFTTKDPLEFVRALVAHPPKYATDQNYVREIERIINGYDRLANARPASLELNGSTTTVESFIQQGKQMLGVPYVGGASSAEGTDCSGFISKLMRDTGVVNPGFRNTAAGLKRYTDGVNGGNVQKGDLMFFWGPHMYSQMPTWNHIAIVLGPPSNGSVEVLDASGKDNEGKVAIRTVKIEDKHSFGRPQFYDNKA